MANTVDVTMPTRARRSTTLTGSRVWLLLPAALLLSASQAAACPVCYSASDPVIISSLNAGIFVLLGVTGVVLAGFLRFIFSLVRRARNTPLLGLEEPQA
jgi:hypothetical protein